MEHNEFNTQYGADSREPLPTMDFTEHPPVFEQASYADPAQQAEVEEVVSGAFSKGLASVIMAWFPFVSILAIIFGIISKRQVKKANDLAARYGISAGGRNIAAKVMSTIGIIAGSVMTGFWVLYGVIIAFYALMMIAIMEM